MMFSRQPHSGLFLIILCFLFILFTSKRLGEWSLQGSFYRTPSLRHPHELGQSNMNATQWKEFDTGRTPIRPHDPMCDNFPNTSNILVVVKTGATESYAKIPTQLMTNLRCVDDFLIFSDMRQRIAVFDIYDSLDTVKSEARDENADFDLYRQQQTCLIDQDSCNSAHDNGRSRGWTLDKYKNIHIAEKTYALRPGYDWYLFIDADTYVLWPNLLQWLRSLDPNKEFYIGSTALINDFPFAHGGSGYILSQAAMHQFVGVHPGTANRFDTRIKDTCCGDYMLAVALNETVGIQVSQAWPTINGEKPYTIPFGPKQWCKPIVTMHHMNPEEISTFWEFERQFYHKRSFSLTRQRPLLFRDIYEEFLAPKIQLKRQDWDNLSNDVRYFDFEADHTESQISRAKQNDFSPYERDAHKSFEHCRKMCSEVEDCFQFSYHNETCTYHKGFLLGKPRKKADKESERWVSGWAVDKIRAWIQEQGQCEEDPVWPKI
ncbi:hypothetical protein F4810DRAFT_647354 [Camillea tinctor]|nr:hypothetical protein F4810DRAFT_647354 [Camillea tinctor]